jgi:hypothetical protein
MSSQGLSPLADAGGMTLKTRRQALLVEFLPIVGGFVALALTPLVFWFGRRQGDSGDPLSTFELALGLPVCVPFLVALFVFAISGVGWINAGRNLIGVCLLFGRGYIGLGFILWAMGGGGGDSWHDPISQQAALIQFALAMAISVVSLVVLAYWTRRPSESVPG